MQKIAQGNTAEVYAYGEGRVLKLFNPQYPAEFVQHEVFNARLAEKLGIITPKVYGTAAAEGRLGIVYDCVEGTTLAQHAAGKNAEEFAGIMKRFAALHKQLLQHTAPEALDYRTFLKMHAVDAEAVAQIEALPGGSTFLHGDYHPENILVDRDGRFICIDMMNVCKGPAAYDVARTWFLLRSSKLVKDMYLAEMGYTEEDIAPYLTVLCTIRQHELGK